MKLQAILSAATMSLLLAFAAGEPALGQTAAAGLELRRTVAADAFGGGDLTAGAASADSLTALLTEALAADPHFIVVERAGLAAVQTEQQLATPAAKAGQLVGAGLLVRGSVTKFNAAAGGGGLSVGGPTLGVLGGLTGGAKTSKATITISLRLIDTGTGLVVATAVGNGEASSRDANVGVTNTRTGATAGTNAFVATPVGKAAQNAILAAVAQLDRSLARLPWSAQVIDNRDGTVFVNAGEEQNVQAGLTLAVFRKGQPLTDPTTGQVLDLALSRIGAIRVQEVREKISTATVVSGEPPARGDILKVEAAH